MYFHSVLFVIGLLIVGYVFCSRLFWLRYRLRLTQGYHTFLFTAAFGTIPIGLGLLVAAMPFMPHVTAGINDLLEAIFSATPPPGIVEVFSLILHGLLLALALPKILHWITLVATGIDEETLRTYAMYTAEPLPGVVSVIFSSYHHGLPVAVTLSDRKVYVGYPAFVSSSMFSPHGGDLHITPLVSGYRDEQTLELNLMTPYEEVLLELEAKGVHNEQSERFLITIPTREVVHAHLYDPSLQPVFDRHAQNLRDNRNPAIQPGDL